MSDWFEDESLWSTFADYMFDPVRLARTPTEVDHLTILLALRRGAHLLDLCCGPGRHSLEFARRGFKITGVDRTARYLEQAREAARKERLDVEFVQSDMREFIRPAAFDGAISMFTSFGYFDDPADDLKVARAIRESLKPGAKLVIDINGKELIAAKFRERDWSRRDDGLIVMEERRVLAAWSRVESRWICLQGSERREVTLVVRLYSAAELVAMLRQAGFSEVAVHGSLAAIPYDNHAERLVAVATK